MIAARWCANGATVLLRACDPVGEAEVCGDVINLRGRLVVPRAPRCCAVNGNDRTLIAGDDHAFRIFWIDPELVVVVAAGRAFDWRPCLPGVAGPVDRRIHHIDHVRILRIDSDFLEIPAAIPETLVVREPGPGRAGVV